MTTHHVPHSPRDGGTRRQPSVGVNNMLLVRLEKLLEDVDLRNPFNEPDMMPRVYKRQET